MRKRIRAFEVLPDRVATWQSRNLGFMTNMLNPKVGVFYLATIPQFVPAGVSPLLMGVLLALVSCVFGMSWFVPAVIFGTKLAVGTAKI